MRGSGVRGSGVSGRSMTSGRVARAKGLSVLLAGAVGLGVLAIPAAAQDQEARLRRVEAELRALQRAVFPGGDGRYFPPEVVAGQTPPQAQPTGTPSSGALTDVLARLDTIESQLARLTARSEEGAFQLGQLEERLQALEATPEPQPFFQPIPSGAAGDAGAATRGATGAPTGVIAPPAATAAPTPAPSAERLAAVRAIAKPATADAGDDEYTYGFRLWEARFYPEAQQQLALFLQRFPSHSRVTFGRNLLGRAYLDNNQPREAATHFFENYQSNRQAARAPDSLLYLAEAMSTINDTNRACIALAEFGDTYPALATGRLRDQYDRNRGRVTCS